MEASFGDSVTLLARDMQLASSFINEQQIDTKYWRTAGKQTYFSR